MAELVTGLAVIGIYVEVFPELEHQMWRVQYLGRRTEAAPFSRTGSRDGVNRIGDV